MSIARPGRLPLAHTLAVALVVALPPTVVLAAAPGPSPLTTPAVRFARALEAHRDLTWEGLASAWHLAPASAPTAWTKPSFDVTRAAFYARVVQGLALDEHAATQLAQRGVVLVGDASSSMAWALHRLFEKDQPLLVTTDMVLDALHRGQDDVLADLEASALAPALDDALGRMQSRLAAGPRTPAAADVDLYLTMARTLLHDATGSSVTPTLARPEEVQALLAKVESGSLENGAEQTTLYGGTRRVDWTQFIPRGHYTASLELSAWFRAMMWLGRPDLGFVRADPRQAAAAALVEQLADASGARPRLDAIVATIDLFVGKSERFGAGAVRGQVVMSAPDAPAHATAPPAWQLFGQRATIDGLVLSKVVYDDIVFAGEKMQRGLPSGLDVAAAVFGNDLAVRLLEPELRRWQYAANLAAARETVAARPVAERTASLYDRWLDALAELSAPPAGAHVPEVMRGEAWARKTLSTQLASWAELRHDTMLFVQQSYSSGGGCVYPKGYVEPYPAFFRKLAALARAGSAGIGAIPVATDGARAVVDHARRYYTRFAAVMDTLAAMADAELAARPFTSAQNAFLRHTIEMRDNTDAGYGAPPLWDGWYMDLVYRDDDADGRALDWKPTIADVHTDATSGKVLEVGTGMVDLAVVAIDNAGDRAVYVGPVMSYHELAVEAAERMDDGAWDERLRDDADGARPAWITPLVGAHLDLE